MKKIFYFTAVVIFCIFVIHSGFYQNKKNIQINLPSVFDEKNLYSNDLIGEPYVLHIFASWCSVCKQP